MLKRSPWLNNIYYNYYNLSLLLLQKVIELIAYQEMTEWKTKKPHEKSQCSPLILPLMGLVLVLVSQLPLFFSAVF